MVEISRPSVLFNWASKVESGGICSDSDLARRAGSLDVGRMRAVADGLGYDRPRGPVVFAGNHLRQRVHLAVADGYDFDVLATL